MDLATTSREDEEWELCNDDGFVYKRKKRRFDSRTLDAAVAQPDQEALERRRHERKKNTLLKLKAKYEREISRWESLSNSLRAMEEKSCQLQREQEHTASLAFPLPSTKEGDSVGGSVVDELLLQVEAQEGIIQDVSHLCDIAEAMCDKKEQQFRQSLLGLPIWASPREIVKLLCDD